MTEDEYNALHSDDDRSQTIDSPPQNKSVPAATPPTAEDDDQGFNDDDNFVENPVSDMSADDEDIGLEEKQESEESGEEKDEKGISYKNRFKEMERKNKVLQAKIDGQQAPPSQQAPPPSILPFQSPPQAAQPVQPAQQLPQQELPQAFKLDPDLEQRAGQITTMAELVAINAEQASRLIQRETQKTTQQEIQRYGQQQAQQQRLNEMGQRMVSDYPELMNPQSLQSQWVTHFIRVDYGGNIEYAELAAHRAAQQLNIQPKSKQSSKPIPRLQPVVGVSEKSAVQQKESSLPKLTPLQLRFAKKMGRDPKKIAQMQQRRKY